MKLILDDIAIQRSLKRIAFEILERNKSLNDIVLVGIQTRGVFLAKKIAEFLQNIENIEVPCIEINVNAFRDDDKKQPHIPQEIAINNKIVVLVDDVLFRGRTVRAALDALTFYGRAKAVQLAVLVDRGHRELPIRADFVGKNVPTSLDENVKVYIKPYDHESSVYISQK